MAQRVWSSDFAYGVGLIASDGWLSRDIGRIGFGSKEMEMMENFRKAFDLKNKIGKHARGGEIEKKYFYLNFRDKPLYDYLGTVGLTPAKSRTIKSVKVPNKSFADFLRGLFDGDGSFYSSWDNRWPHSFVFKTSFASASIAFVRWLKERISELYDVKGYMYKGVGVLNLEYVKGDSKKLFRAMYYSDGGLLILFLSAILKKRKDER